MVCSMVNNIICPVFSLCLIDPIALLSWYERSVLWAELHAMSPPTVEGNNNEEEKWKSNIILPWLWYSSCVINFLLFPCKYQHDFWQPKICQVEEKLESGQGKTAVRRFFSRFCTPIFLEVCLWSSFWCTEVDSISAVQSEYMIQMSIALFKTLFFEIF